MKNNKKKDKPLISKSDENFASVIDELTEAMTEDLGNEKNETLEPFEQYAQKVRGRMHADFNAFRSRFVKGYNALLEEIVHEHDENRKHTKST